MAHPSPRNAQKYWVATTQPHSRMQFALYSLYHLRNLLHLLICFIGHLLINNSLLVYHKRQLRCTHYLYLDILV